MTRKCLECGAEFVGNAQKLYCSRRCTRIAAKRRYLTSDVRHAVAQSCPVSNERIMAALVKPENTSETRWRMELRRRANPERYAFAGWL